MHTPVRFVVEISQSCIDLEIFQHCQHLSEVCDAMVKSTSGYRAWNGVVRKATIGTAVGIAAMRR